MDYNPLAKLDKKSLNKFDFNKSEYDYIVEQCNFTERQRQILDLRRKGSTVLSIGFKLYLSERTISREIREIKRKICKLI